MSSQQFSLRMKDAVSSFIAQISSIHKEFNMKAQINYESLAKAIVDNINPVKSEAGSNKLEEMISTQEDQSLHQKQRKSSGLISHTQIKQGQKKGQMSRRGRIRKEYLLNIEQNVVIWIQKQLQKNYIPSKKQIRDYARNISNHTQFKASKLWFMYFLQRNPDLQQRMQKVGDNQIDGSFLFGKPCVPQKIKKNDQKIKIWIEKQLDKGNIPTIYSIGMKILTKNYGQQKLNKLKSPISRGIYFLRRHPLLRKKLRQKQNQKTTLKAQKTMVDKPFLTHNQFILKFKQMIPSCPKIEAERLILRLDPKDQQKIEYLSALKCLKQFKDQEQKQQKEKQKDKEKEKEKEKQLQNLMKQHIQFQHFLKRKEQNLKQKIKCEQSE